ncbi:MAG TPA: nitroreductase/quinone reductase family protein [Acidimicrobiales bacterium]|jgi:deazaflavin-dependent oxidoreductase (nitroreductase family)|nr:nitroreductase/quinone reductase family protein [Acidimicrobiales bacterium]|tara:strand:- start:6817 stop:7317 length:501 start_codon:yes stop_codon:yes gene_type:complete
MSDELQPTEQHVEQIWETPSRPEIVELTKTHVQAMEMTDDDLVWVQAGMHHVLLTTIGRKSGNEHKVALPTWKDENGVRVVVASFAGADKSPSWFINLRDREANPKILCQVQDGKFWSEPEILEGEERNMVWRQLCTDRAWYENYQNRTDREIPLVRLPETQAIED